MTNETSTSTEYEEQTIEKSEIRENRFRPWSILSNFLLGFAIFSLIFNFVSGLLATPEKRDTLILPTIGISLIVFGLAFWKRHLYGKIKNERDLQALYRAQIAGRQPSSK